MSRRTIMLIVAVVLALALVAACCGACGVPGRSDCSASPAVVGMGAAGDLGARRDAALAGVTEAMAKPGPGGGGSGKAGKGGKGKTKVKLPSWLGDDDCD